jgi:hypothetical protein
MANTAMITPERPVEGGVDSMRMSQENTTPRNTEN